MSLGIKVNLSPVKAWEQSCDALVLFVPEKEKDYFPLFKEINKRMNGALSSVLKEEHFIPKIGSFIVYHVSSGVKAKRVILLLLRCPAFRKSKKRE
jgi:hypothetical protein